jgi:hypothetical protein
MANLPSGAHRFAALIAIGLVAGTIFAMSKSPGLSEPAPTVIFQLNGTRFYVPSAWTITAVDSKPPYDPRAPQPHDVQFNVTRSILLQFPGRSTQADWRTRYPQIKAPFADEVVLQPGPKELEPLRRNRPVAPDPVFAKAFAEGRPDEDGFIKLGEKSYVAVRADDNDGAGGYLRFYCRADIAERDRGVASHCSVYTYPRDGIGLRIGFDSLDFRKSQWREIVERTHSCVRWLAAPPDQRSQNFDQ